MTIFRDTIKTAHTNTAQLLCFLFYHPNHRQRTASVHERTGVEEQKHHREIATNTDTGGILANESPNGSSSSTLFPGPSLGVMRSICVMPRCMQLSSCSRSTRSATDSGDFSLFPATIFMAPLDPAPIDDPPTASAPSAVSLE